MAKDNFNVMESAKLVAFGAGIFLLYKVFKGAGLIKTGAELQASQQAASQEAQAQILNLNIGTEEYSKPDFWKQPAPAGYTKYVFTATGEREIITKLWDSVGLFDDCEQCMQAQLLRINYKTQYSQLVDAFQKKYGRDLTNWLKEYYNETELFPAWQHIESRPAYKKN